MMHRLSDGTLRFQLWEIKKYVQRTVDTATAANSVISRAYQQLEDNALEYLARYTAIGQELDPELEDFFGRLVELWIDADPSAAAGVSLNTTVNLIPPSTFHDFGAKFPKLVNPIRLCGMIAAVEDFTLFSTMVRDFVWKGL